MILELFKERVRKKMALLDLILLFLLASFTCWLSSENKRESCYINYLDFLKSFVQVYFRTSDVCHLWHGFVSLWIAIPSGVVLNWDSELHGFLPNNTLTIPLSLYFLTLSYFRSSHPFCFTSACLCN